jgi:hypothetical protein
MASAGASQERSNAIFHRAMIREKVKILPREIGSNVREVVLAKLRRKLEGFCSRHGYVRPGSVRIHELSPGRVEGASLNGDVIFSVAVAAEVCNPVMGHVVPARIVNSNKFGLLAHSSIEVNGKYANILEVVITRHNFYGTGTGSTGSTGTLGSTGNTGITGTPGSTSEVPIDTVRVGDDVFVEVIGKTFELGDTKISVAGRLLRVIGPTPGGRRALLPITLVDQPFAEDVESNNDGEVSGSGEPDDEVSGSGEDDDAASKSDDGFGSGDGDSNGDDVDVDGDVGDGDGDEADIDVDAADDDDFGAA